jgi:outer membrane protein assembly factor BamE (lipoprotein component of BamABCDE complex)
MMSAKMSLLRALPRTSAPKILAVLALAGVALSACAPTIARQGFQVQDSAPKDLKVGMDTKSTVLEKLGSPSAIATFDPNTWYYVTQTTERYTYHMARVTSRDVTVVTFDKGSEKLTKLDTVGLKDGRKIAYNDRVTPTRGRSLTVLEQLLGNVGRTVLPETDNEGPNGPGGRRPE